MAERESTSRRQYLREHALQTARRYMRNNHCGTDRSGANFWPFTRRNRRQMERDRAGREFRALRSQPQPVLHKASVSVESEG